MRRLRDWLTLRSALLALVLIGWAIACPAVYVGRAARRETSDDAGRIDGHDDRARGRTTQMSIITFMTRSSATSDHELRRSRLGDARTTLLDARPRAVGGDLDRRVDRAPDDVTRAELHTPDTAFREHREHALRALRAERLVHVG